MPVIHLNTEIAANIELCFDLSRSIDLHQISTSHTGEKAIEGRTSGLIGPGEFVTWKARHLGIWQELSSGITEYNYPFQFADEMIKGPFKQMIHIHKFSSREFGTLMTDEFNFETPLGLLGHIANHIFLKRYMTRLLKIRNTTIKKFAESNQWKSLPGFDRHKIEK